MNTEPPKRKQFFGPRSAMFGRKTRAKLVSRWEFSSSSRFECMCLVCNKPIAKHLPRFWSQGYGARHEGCEVGDG